MKILVAGATGQLGLGISRVFAREGQVVAFPRSALDITDHEAVLRTTRETMPDVIVNCAAYNDVDGAEADPVTAMRVNGLGVHSLAKAANNIGAVFVHYGSDFVFDGNTNEPYGESSIPGPQSVYATSKLVGEWFAGETPRHYVLRVESLFGGGAEVEVPGRRLGGSLDRMVDALLEGRPVQAFTDRVVSPSYVPDVAAATLGLVRRQAEAGIYHCVNTGLATWFEVAQVAASLLGGESRLAQTTLDKVQLGAVRPRFCALSNRKLLAAGVPMPTWEDALDRYLTVRRATVARRLRDRFATS